MDVKALIGDVDISTSVKVDEVLELIKGKEVRFLFIEQH